MGPNVSVITDISYHQKTIYYLKRLHYFTIGLVPSIYSIKSVDLAIPSATDSLTNQVLFIRLLLLIKQSARNEYIKQLKTLW